ncbi:MAG TPA: DUF1616 domain-containing protein [Fervidicoccus fontis]|uniref:DUF1616 domain-containing protein n=1 Tax=Fervidicoccus fontis TaxID=683846 RepID=A0A7C2UTY8_9CREN|nr:MAG: hypothetical protein C0179_07505 [Fervidicoccus sp.]HEU97483.1 DUF1616 domain-containing protein [Fervidicoccus fontis]
MEGEGEVTFLDDEEVFAVIIAIAVVGSVLGAAMILRSSSGEKFGAIGLLNDQCKIGNYPAAAVNGSEVNLCLFVYNHYGEPTYFKVEYKIGDNSTLPTNSTASPLHELKEWRVILNNNENATFPISVPVYAAVGTGEEKALIFELWIYNLSDQSWEYSGLWTDLYINITGVR